MNKSVIYTEDQYRQYNKYNFFMANTDIYNGAKAYCDLKEWLEEENLPPEAIAAMDKRVEKEFKDGYTSVDLSTLDNIEYISLMAMMGKLDATQIIAYMRACDMDRLTLTNGIIIQKDKIGNYIAVFETEEDGIDSIDLDLFLLLNKKQNKKLNEKNE